LWTAAAAIVLLGCDRAPSGLPASLKHRIKSNGGRYAVELETSPSQVQVNQPFDVTVWVMPTSSASPALDVQVDARMPAHFHGMTRLAKVTRGSGNSWKAEGMLFHMPGHWELYVDITENGLTERAQLDVDLR
jgi:hypothetical protein